VGLGYFLVQKDKWPASKLLGINFKNISIDKILIPFVGLPISFCATELLMISHVTPCFFVLYCMHIDGYE
jgi:hypothetical protein